MKKQKTRTIINRLDKKFSKKIRERDKKCLRCGSTENLQCSHIISRDEKLLRWDMRNAITLCKGCHIGWGHNRPFRLQQFHIGIIGKEMYDKLTLETNTKIFDHDYKRIELELNEKNNIN